MLVKKEGVKQIRTSNSKFAIHMRVLIVDDQPIFRQHLRDLLIRGGFVWVVETGDIPTAVKAAQKQNFGLAVVDVMLPGVNGIEGVRRLHAIAPEMRVIVVSAYSNSTDFLRQAALAAGAEAFYSKEQLAPALLATWKEAPQQEET